MDSSRCRSSNMLLKLLLCFLVAGFFFSAAKGTSRPLMNVPDGEGASERASSGDGGFVKIINGYGEPTHPGQSPGVGHH